MKPALNPVDEEKYSQLAPLAVIAFLLGVASLLAFIGPLFYLVPIAAVGVALIALGKISRSDGVLSGARLARLGIAVATVCLVASLVRGGVRDRMLKDQAGATSLRWLQMMTAGDVDSARELLTNDAAGSLVHREPGGQQPPVEELERMIRERLQADSLVKDFAGVKNPLIKVTAAGEPVSDAGRTIVRVEAVMGDPATGSHRHVHLQLVRNSFYETQGEPWRIDPWAVDAAHGAH
ncbi:hypothetical protein [Lacipirellula parvula]|uniref:Uncharacterized protein n=1 Tax=Lacipirellula parvula TaxID=2650471 RepID=A0A5K7XFR7_9BACT|nr:hypothetical protein [Lacipirellula parvula]BBO35358.1 hypothetical protein PLANPX_4970 [Lacipirellula parvula]